VSRPRCCWPPPGSRTPRCSRAPRRCSPR
jgi:hypothetical protein